MAETEIKARDRVAELRREIEEHNRRYYEEALNPGSFDRLDDLLTDGRIAEHWGVFDQLAMLGQLGALGG